MHCLIFPSTVPATFSDNFSIFQPVLNAIFFNEPKIKTTFNNSISEFDNTRDLFLFRPLQEAIFKLPKARYALFHISSGSAPLWTQLSPNFLAPTEGKM